MYPFLLSWIIYTSMSIRDFLCPYEYVHLNVLILLYRFRQYQDSLFIWGWPFRCIHSVILIYEHFYVSIQDCPFGCVHFSTLLYYDGSISCELRWIFSVKWASIISFRICFILPCRVLSFCTSLTKGEGNGIASEFWERFFGRGEKGWKIIISLSVSHVRCYGWTKYFCF